MSPTLTPTPRRATSPKLPLGRPQIGWSLGSERKPLRDLPPQSEPERREFRNAFGAHILEIGRLTKLIVNHECDSFSRQHRIELQGYSLTVQSCQTNIEATSPQGSRVLVKLGHQHLFHDPDKLSTFRIAATAPVTYLIPHGAEGTRRVIKEVSFGITSETSNGRIVYNDTVSDSFFTKRPSECFSVLASNKEAALLQIHKMLDVLIPLLKQYETALTRSQQAAVAWGIE